MDAEDSRDAETMPGLQFAELERGREDVPLFRMRPYVDGARRSTAETMPTLQQSELAARHVRRRNGGQTAADIPRSMEDGDGDDREELAEEQAKTRPEIVRNREAGYFPRFSFCRVFDIFRHRAKKSEKSHAAPEKQGREREIAAFSVRP